MEEKACFSQNTVHYARCVECGELKADTEDFSDGLRCITCVEAGQEKACFFAGAPCDCTSHCKALAFEQKHAFSETEPVTKSMLFSPGRGLAETRDARKSMLSDIAHHRKQRFVKRLDTRVHRDDLIHEGRPTTKSMLFRFHEFMRVQFKRTDVSPEKKHAFYELECGE